MLHPKNGSLSKLIQPGTVLWRQVRDMAEIHGTQTYIEDVAFELTDKGSYMAKVDLMPCSFIHEPEIHQAHVTQGGRKYGCKGIVVFVPKQPSANWTHLFVAKATDKVIFAQEAPALPLKEYQRFRNQMTQAVRVDLNNSFEDKVAVATKLRVDVGDLKRLVISHAPGSHFADGPNQYEYEYI